MDFLISTAYAQTGDGGQGGGMAPLLLMVLFIAFMYFLILRPQSKRAKEHRALVAALSTGDEVVTSGGVLGKVTEVGDQFVSVEICDGVEVKVQKQSVGAILPKGTMKSV